MSKTGPVHFRTQPRKPNRGVSLYYYSYNDLSRVLIAVV